MNARGRFVVALVACALSGWSYYRNASQTTLASTRPASGTYRIGELIYMGATHTFSYLGFNEQGHVSGSLWAPNGKYVASLYDGKKLITIGMLPGDSGSRVYGMNDNDVVVGASYKYDNTYWMRTTRGFSWNGRELQKLGPVKGLPCSRAWSVNIHGVVVGNSYRPLNEQRDARSIPTRWRDGAAEPLPLPQPATDGIAYAINDQGEIAGTVTLPDGTTRACTWRSGAVEVLPPLSGDTATLATSINAHGTVLACSQGSKATTVLWSAQKTTAIDPVPGVSRLQPVKINDADSFIANDPDTPGYPFLWRRGIGYVRISRLINSQGYSLWKGLGLNNRGQIAVGGRFQGVRSSVFLVSPP